MRRPSPALVIAVLALIGAWGGPAIARALIHGRDIAANTVTGRNVARLSGRDVIPNGLDGSDIDEQSLDPVPAADRAERARVVEGVSFARFAYADPTGALKSFLDEAGLKVSAFCDDANLQAKAEGTGTGGLLRLVILTPTGSKVVSDNEFTRGKRVDLLPSGLNDAAGSLTFYTPGGDTLTLQYIAQDGLPAATGHQCVIAGTAVRAKK